MRPIPAIEEANPETDPNKAIEDYYNNLEDWAKEAETEMEILKLLITKREQVLYEALKKAKLVIQLWHPVEDHWESYNKEAPSMRLINKALER